ncbi:STAM-binding protein-like A [Tubulanus polymorphus]|uniref:STAM-binding protein-like A n=1 Tax=Tubulanus polymorphus TaxID=672921 RepID=UPI003DA5646C
MNRVPAEGLFPDIRDPGKRVCALCDYGCQVDVDPTIPPRRYFRSGLEMIRMANVYYEEGNLESAFILYSKFISLFVEKLPKHPEYRTTQTVDRANNKKKLEVVFPKAEQVKKLLKEKYAVEEARRKEEEKKHKAKLVKEELAKQEEKERQRREEEEKLKHQQNQILLEESERLRLLREKEIEQQKNQLGPPTPFDQLPPVSPSAPPGGEIPIIDRSSKPDHFTSTGSKSLNKHGFKDVIVPDILMDTFLNIAQPNTAKSIETCGILCGKLSQNAFIITNLVIPNQSGTPDSCSTDCEEDMFEYQDQHDLITLGWIHTHPTQTAFLSSVDLHTHCSYQLMMPEAIAIVCSPKYNETGFFSLTPDYGLQFIANCRQRGFHPHPSEPALFETGSHVKVNNTKNVVVADLRKK